MDSSQVNLFSTKLSSEFQALGWQDRNELLIKIGRAEARMRGGGQEHPVWRGPLPEDRLLGADVVVPTDQGDRRGRVIGYGIIAVGLEFERSVVVHVPASGTHHEVPGSLTRVASAEDSDRIKNELDMARKLSEVAAEVQKGPTPLPASAAPKKRGQKDPKLIERFIAAAKTSNNVRNVEEGSSNFKVMGVDSDKRLYVFKNQLRVDVSGFSFDHPGLRRITDDEARDMHLGKVRGQILFDDREVAMQAFEKALEGLR